MKRITLLAGLLLLSILLASCSKESQDIPKSGQGSAEISSTGPQLKDMVYLDELIYCICGLHNAQGDEIGTVFLYGSLVTGILDVTFEVVPGYLITAYHFDLQESLAAIPQTKKGEPIPGRFPYKSGLSPCETHTFTMPYPEYLECNEQFFSAAHLEIVPVSGSSFCIWAGTDEFVPGGNPATYFMDASMCID